MYKTRNEKFTKESSKGIIGEKFFETYIFPKHFKPKGFYYCYDIRDTESSKFFDIDYVLEKLNENATDNSDLVKFQSYLDKQISKHTLKNLEKANFLGIEVKTDTRILKTGNIVYDVTSHDKAGGLARSRCDFLVYVCITEKEHNIEKYIIINMFKLRKYLRENHDKINVKGSGIKTHCFYDAENKSDGESLLFLININNLTKKNIAIIKETNGTL